MRLVSSKVDLGSFEYVLHTRTEPVFALCRCRNWEKSKEHARNEISGFPVHFVLSDERWRVTMPNTCPVARSACVISNPRKPLIQPGIVLSLPFFFVLAELSIRLGLCKKFEILGKADD